MAVVELGFEREPERLLNGCRYCRMGVPVLTEPDSKVIICLAAPAIQEILAPGTANCTS